MDETKTWWFRWMANNAHHLVPIFLWGGMGAFTAVFFKAVSPTGYALPVYLSVLPGLIGWALGYASSGFRDKLSDIRSMRRKANNARLRIIELRSTWVMPIMLVNSLNQFGKAPIADGGANLSQHDREILVVAAETASRAAEKEPDFDDIIDSETDFEHATKVREVCILTKVTFLGAATHSPDRALQEKIVRIVIEVVQDGTAGKMLDKLTAAEEHFLARYGWSV